MKQRTKRRDFLLKQQQLHEASDLFDDAENLMQIVKINNQYLSSPIPQIIGKPNGGGGGGAGSSSTFAFSTPHSKPRGSSIGDRSSLFPTLCAEDINVNASDASLFNFSSMASAVAAAGGGDVTGGSGVGETIYTPRTALYAQFGNIGGGEGKSLLEFTPGLGDSLGDLLDESGAQRIMFHNKVKRKPKRPPPAATSNSRHPQTHAGQSPGLGGGSNTNAAEDGQMQTAQGSKRSAGAGPVLDDLCDPFLDNSNNDNNNRGNKNNKRFKMLKLPSHLRIDDSAQNCRDSDPEDEYFE